MRIVMLTTVRVLLYPVGKEEGERRLLPRGEQLDVEDETPEGHDAALFFAPAEGNGDGAFLELPLPSFAAVPVRRLTASAN